MPVKLENPEFEKYRIRKLGTTLKILEKEEKKIDHRNSFAYQMQKRKK